MKDNAQRLLSIIVTAAFLTMPVIAETAPATQLESIENCPALLAELRETAIEEMEERLDANRQRIIQGDGCPSKVMSLVIFASPDSATEYSVTNVQTADVDEADFVKNDGAYIYTLANGKFRIVDAWPPEEAHEIAAFDIEGTPKKMFIHDGRAFIYSSLDRIVQNDYYYGNSDTECTYGYNCDFTGDGRELKITVLDIEDVAAPSLLREMRFSGAYLNSRRIGNAVYSVVIFPEPLIAAGLKYWPDGITYCENSLSEAEITAKFEALKAENRQRIQSADITDWLPTMTDIRYNDGVPQENHALFENCNNFYRTEQKDGTNFLSIISTDNNGIASLNATTIMGKPGAVYASNSALYVAARHSQNSVQSPWFFGDEAQIEEASTIHKFSLTQEPPASQYSASGVVKGRVLNQFSMDEFEGFFRIATTSGYSPAPNTHSTISILEHKSAQLEVVGQIDNIAPTEDIRSARFIGDKGYIVTFKKTDPLFVLDLSDPYQPTIAGELKIPGFSTYMHRIDDDHLLTIGYDQGIMLQIFDVSDMTNPMLTYREVIGTRDSTSEAATNHLAFNYFGSKALLAIPMTICENGGRYGDMMTFNGLLVYDINVETGFDYLGSVSHVAPESQDNYRDACNNLWPYVKRSIFMDDYVFSITWNTIKTNHMSAIGTDIAVIDFADEQPKCDAFHVELCVTETDCGSINGEWKAETASCRLPLYSPVRSSSANLCTASYDILTGAFEVPCVAVAGTQYNAAMSLTSSSPIQLALTSVESAPVRLAARGCEAGYDPSTGIVHVPCINILGALYWADFSVETGTPFTMELTNLGIIN